MASTGTHSSLQPQHIWCKGLFDVLVEQLSSRSRVLLHGSRSRALRLRLSHPFSQARFPYCCWHCACIYGQRVPGALVEHIRVTLHKSHSIRKEKRALTSQVYLTFVAALTRHLEMLARVSMEEPPRPVLLAFGHPLVISSLIEHPLSSYASPTVALKGSLLSSFCAQLSGMLFDIAVSAMSLPSKRPPARCSAAARLVPRLS